MTRVIKDLTDALGESKRPLGFLLGAGCPGSIRVGEGRDEPLIPDMCGLTSLARATLAADEGFRFLEAKFSEDGNESPNVEAMLTTVRNLLRVAGAGRVRGLDREQLTRLERAICEAVFQATKATLPWPDTPYHKLCRWIRDTDRAEPVSLFTTNYDLLLEQALEEEEVPFFDGFSGACRPFFDPQSIEADGLPSRWARLWKLHGSINWRKLENSGRGGHSVVRAMPAEADLEGMLIHPSEFKYDQSRRMPYLAMFDRLRAFLRTPRTLLVTCGYSFGDEHLNETLVEGLAANPGAMIFGLLYKKLADEPGAGSLLPRMPANLAFLSPDEAVLRRRRENWTPPEAAGDQDLAPAGVVNQSFGLGNFERLADFVVKLAGEQTSSTLGGP